MIRFACLGALLAALALPGQPQLQTGAASVVTARQKEPAFAMGGKKVCPFGTCAQPHLGRLPLAAISPM
jgi:hypothetical protein